MRTRRNFLAASAAAGCGILGGCLGVLGDSEDSEAPRGPDDLGPLEQPSAVILVWPNTRSLFEERTNEVELNANPGGADRIEIYLDGSLEHTFERQANSVTVADEVEDGTNVEAVAVYENGAEEVLDERCIGCNEVDNTRVPDSDSSDVDPGDSDSSDIDLGDSNEPVSTREEIVDERVPVQEDGYRYWSFELNRRSTVSFSYTVRSGPEIDVFVVSDAERKEFENENRFLSYLSSDGITGEESGTLTSGTYSLIVDNTNAGSVSPPTNLEDDTADVEIEAHAEG